MPESVSTAAPPAPVIHYVVQADRKTGRLIRRAVVVPPAGAPGARPAAKKKVPAEIDSLVRQAAKEYAVDPLLVHAVIEVESNYNPHAVSPAGAEGLMQLMPATARELGVKNSFDAEQNIRAGVRHLRDLQSKYQNDRLALAAYNAGAGAVARYGTVPPFRETQDYVYKVGKKYGDARRDAPTQTETTTASSPQPEVPKQPEYRPIETFTDSEGRLHIRTK